MELQLSGSDSAPPPRRVVGALLTLRRAATDNNLTRKCEEAGDCDQYTQQHVRVAAFLCTRRRVAYTRSRAP